MGVGGLALVTGLLILAWSAVQLTERSQATRVLQQTLVPLSDIDRLLARDYAALQTQAQADAGGSVIVQSYPLGIAIPAAELSEMSRDAVRAHVLSVSAERIYESGAGAFAPDEAGRGSFFSPSGVFALTAGQLTARNHTIAIIVGALLALFFVPMLVRALSEGSGAERARNLGAGLLLGGLGLAIALLVGRSLLRGVLSTDDGFSDALLDVGLNAAGLPIRNGVIFGALGALVLAAALGFETLLWRWAGRRAWAEGG
jgi:NADH:ubiquinone oxidoreductase subunit 6 (subunit J)